MFSNKKDDKFKFFISLSLYKYSIPPSGQLLPLRERFRFCQYMIGTPYIAEYYKDGVKETIRRVPPPKLHDLEEGDEVTISQKGDDWDKGDKVEIKAINARQPNTLTIEKSNGDYTFLPYDDVELKDKSPLHYIREGKDPLVANISLAFMLKYFEVYVFVYIRIRIQKNI